MSESMEGRKAGLKAGLKYGDATAIANELGLSKHHVALVIRGLREPSAKLAKAIARKRRANERAAARQAAKQATEDHTAVGPVGTPRAA